MTAAVQPTITETLGIGGRRTLSAGDPMIVAVHHPGSQHRPESWSIVARLDLPPAEVGSEEAARAWLMFLATAQADEARS